MVRASKLGYYLPFFYLNVYCVSGGRWVHENADVVVNAGDTVNYWTLVIRGGQGFQRTDQSWTAASGDYTTIVISDNNVRECKNNSIYQYVHNVRLLSSSLYRMACI